MKYDDQYSTCESTYASLRFFHKDLIPESIDELLGIKSSYCHKNGEPTSIKFPEKGIRKFGCWLLSTENKVESKDSRCHIDWLLDQVIDKADVIKDLQSEDYKIDHCCGKCWAESVFIDTGLHSFSTSTLCFF